MSVLPHPQIGDVWHRVDGAHIGDEVYQGMELEWRTYTVVKVTPRGAWLRCVEYDWNKARFALADGARWVSRTKDEALERLVARKKRHLDILRLEQRAAEDTLAVALIALKEPT